MRVLSRLCCRRFRCSQLVNYVGTLADNVTSCWLSVVVNVNKCTT